MRRSVFLMMGLAAIATPAWASGSNHDNAALLQQATPSVADTTMTTGNGGRVIGRGDAQSGYERPDFNNWRAPGTVVPRDPDAVMGTRSSLTYGTGADNMAAARMASPTQTRAPSTMPVSGDAGEEEGDDESDGPFSFSAGVAVTSDYMFRGYTQTDDKLALQGYVGVEHESGLYGEIWASNVDFNDDEANAEVDFLLSYSHEFDPVTAEIGAAYYYYPGVPNDWNYDYTEIYLALYADLLDGALSNTWSAYYSSDFFGGSGDAEYLEWAATVPVSWQDMDLFDVNGTLGYQWIDDNMLFGAPDYMNWSLGLSRTLFDVLTASVTYTGTDVDNDDCDNLCGDRIVGTVALDF